MCSKYSGCGERSASAALRAKKDALEKLITAGRQCLLEKVGDEHHVYEL
jgi:hypothetical protein